MTQHLVIYSTKVLNLSYCNHWSNRNYIFRDAFSKIEIRITSFDTLGKENCVYSAVFFLQNFPSNLFKLIPKTKASMLQEVLKVIT